MNYLINLVIEENEDNLDIMLDFEKANGTIKISTTTMEILNNKNIMLHNKTKFDIK